jgi:hypothetical protein
MNEANLKAKADHPEQTTKAIGNAALTGPQSCESSQYPTGDCEGAIRVLAHSKWERAGRPSGDGLNFWLEAEREVRCGD